MIVETPARWPDPVEFNVSHFYSCENLIVRLTTRGSLTVTSMTAFLLPSLQGWLIRTCATTGLLALAGASAPV